jgi:N-acetylmuramoyl-L-alanine amidase
MTISQYLTQINYKTANKTNKWIVIHYTANNGDSAWANCNYFSKQYRGASANYFVDENEIWQCVEDKDIAWHVGANKYYNDCRNDNSIGIELCSRIDANGQYYFKDKTILNAIELTKMLMKKYNIDINHVCRHYDVTRKLCPAPFVNDPKAWKIFLSRLEEKSMTKEEQIALIKEKAGLDDNTIQYLQFYRYGDALIEKLANAMK